jgi:hypothetical protein
VKGSQILGFPRRVNFLPGSNQGVAWTISGELWWNWTSQMMGSGFANHNDNKNINPAVWMTMTMGDSFGY